MFVVKAERYKASSSSFILVFLCSNIHTSMSHPNRNFNNKHYHSDQMFNNILRIPNRERVGAGYEYMDPHSTQAPARYHEDLTLPSISHLFQPAPAAGAFYPPRGARNAELFSPPSSPDYTTPVASPATTPVSLIVLDSTPTKCRPDFSSKEYLALAGVVVEVNPFGAKHGQKGAKWEEVSKAVKAEKLFLKSSTETIKHKMSALLKYHEVNPPSFSYAVQMFTCLYHLGS